MKIMRLNIKFILFILTTLMIIQGYLFYRFIEDMQSTRRWTQHTYEVILNLTQLQNELRLNNLNYLQYLRSGNKSFIDHNTDVYARLNAIQQLTHDNSIQQQAIISLKPLLNEQYASFKQLTEKNLPNLLSADNGFDNNRFLNIDTQITQIINGMINVEKNLLKGRNTQNDHARERFFHFNFYAAISSYLILFGFIILLMRGINEQKRLQKEKIKANDRFQKIFELSTDAHLIFDDEGIIECNDAVLKMLKCYDKEQIKHHHPSEFSPVTQADNITPQVMRKTIEAKLKEAGYVKFNWILKRFDGVEIPIEVSITSIILDEKEVSLAIWHDISEQKKYQHMLEQLHNINANKSLPLPQKIKQIIQLGCSYFHMPKGIMGKVENHTFLAFYTSDDDSVIRAGGHFALNANTTRFFNPHILVAYEKIPEKQPLILNDYKIGCLIACPIYVHGKPYGTICYFKGKPHLEPFSESEKTFIHIISQWIGSEIESNLVLKELESNRYRLERAIKNVQDGLWEWNCITNKIYINERYKEILGYGENDDFQLNDLESFSKLIHPDDADKVWDTVKQAFENDTPFNIKFRLLCKNGNYIWTHSRGNVYRDHNGKPTSVSGILTPISDEKITKIKG